MLLAALMTIGTLLGCGAVVAVVAVRSRPEPALIPLRVPERWRRRHSAR